MKQESSPARGHLDVMSSGGLEESRSTSKPPVYYLSCGERKKPTGGGGGKVLRGPKPRDCYLKARGLQKTRVTEVLLVNAKRNL